MATLYNIGFEVEKDKNKAYNLFKMAGKSGVIFAKYMLFTEFREGSQSDAMEYLRILEDRGILFPAKILTEFVEKFFIVFLFLVTGNHKKLCYCSI